LFGKYVGQDVGFFLSESGDKQSVEGEESA